MTKRIFAAILSSLTIVTVTLPAPTNARSVNSQSAILTSPTDKTDRGAAVSVPDRYLGSSDFRQPIEVIFLVTMVACAWKANDRQKQSLQPAKKVARNPSSPNAVSRETFDRAMMLVKDDLQCIERLLNSVRLKHPERSEQWCWEKIIYDLERDRCRA